MKSIEYPSECAQIALCQDIGRLTPAHEVQLLIALARRTRGAIVEIGCNRGTTTRELALAFPDRRIYAVDKVKHGMRAEQSGEAVTPETFCDRARELPNVVLVERPAVWDIPEDAGFIFVDGDHSLEGVLDDTATAMRHQEERGDVMIVWHDVYPDAPEWCKVWTVVDMIAETRAVFRVEGTNVAFLHE